MGMFLALSNDDKTSYSEVVKNALSESVED
jgi:hypothetical protein